MWSSMGCRLCPKAEFCPSQPAARRTPRSPKFAITAPEFRSEVQDKIFELYFTTKKEGNGIGLAQTYQILQWHYGSVDFESKENEGTTFRFRVPLVNSSLTSEPIASSQFETAL